MDPNDADLALIAELKRLNGGKDGPIPIASLSAGLQEAFERTHPLAACPMINGQVCMQPADWARFAAREKQDAMQRMRLRSLELAMVGPTPGDLAQAPILSHWIAIENPQSHGALLMGSAPDHPICVGNLIMTSYLCGIAEDGSWARTISRWYRLQEPATLDAFLKRNSKKVSGVVPEPLKLWQMLAIAAKGQEELGAW